MYSFNLLKRSLRKSIDINLFKNLFIFYLVFSVIYEPIQIGLVKNLLLPFSSLISSPFAGGIIGGALGLITGIVTFVFYTILLTAIRSSEEESKIRIPRMNILSRKIFKVYLSALFSSLLIGLGSLAFIVPGVILFKRYIYVSIIAEKEDKMGLIDILRRSREVSDVNGWLTVRSLFYSFGLYFILFLLVYLVNPAFNISESVVVDFFAGWFFPVIFYSTSFYGFQDAVNHQLET